MKLYTLVLMEGEFYTHAPPCYVIDDDENPYLGDKQYIEEKFCFYQKLFPKAVYEIMENT